MLRLRVQGRSIRHIAAALGRPASSIQVRLDWLRDHPAEAAARLAQEEDMARKKAMNGSGERLLSMVERIERIQEEIKGLRGDIADIKLEAKSAGFDVKVMMQMLRERQMDPADRQEWEALCDIYRAALGMLDGTPLGEAARKRMVATPPEAEPASPSDEPPQPPPTEAEPEAAPAAVAESLPAAKEQGAEAARTGIKVTGNPYAHDDPRRAAWDEGWCAETGSDGMELPPAWRRSKPRKGDDKGGQA